MNRTIAVVAMVVLLTLPVIAQQTVQIPISTTIAGPSPWLDVKAYGAVGNGTTNDHDAIQSAIDACPATGCTIYFPSSTATYRIDSTLHIHVTGLTPRFGVKLLGECGAQGHTGSETCGRIASGISGIILLEVGDVNTVFANSGLVIQDLGFQDKMGGGAVAGAIHLIQTQNFSLINIQCRDITIGYCMQFDGGNGNADSNFTQFGTVVNPRTVNTEFPVQIVPEASEISFYGGDFNCNGMTGSIGMDLRATGSLKAGGEFSVFGTHMINCLIGISMFNMSNLNYYGIMEQPNMDQQGDGIIIDGNISHADKSIISGSIDGFTRGVTLKGTAQNTRLLANITNTDTPLITVSGSLPSTAIITPQIYGAGSGGTGTAIGSQLPDLTIPGESTPAVPASGSRRLYVDNLTAHNSDLTVERSDGTIIDLEGGLLSYQGTGATVTGGLIAKTVYTFTIPSIKAGAGIRAKVFWQTTASMGNNKNFVWKFGSTALFYSGDPTSNGSLSSAEVTVFNNPGSQGNQTMFSSPIINQTSLVVGGGIASPAEPTAAPVTLLFQLNPGSGTETITPKGFILEAVQ